MALLINVSPWIVSYSCFRLRPKKFSKKRANINSAKRKKVSAKLILIQRLNKALSNYIWPFKFCIFIFSTWLSFHFFLFLFFICVLNHCCPQPHLHLTLLLNWYLISWHKRMCIFSCNIVAFTYCQQMTYSRR